VSAEDIRKSELLSELKKFLQIDQPLDEIYKKCQVAALELNDEWANRGINPEDKKAVTQFYLDTNLYCYELIGLEIDTPVERIELLKKLASRMKENGKIHGCDYGSGVGTLGLFFHEQGIHCDFADVSELNLKFIRERLKRRNLSGFKTYQIPQEHIPDGSCDFITVFDVFEHVVDPLDHMKTLRRKLKLGGWLIFNLIYHDYSNTPHILRDPTPIRKNIRGLGYKFVSKLNEFKIYQRVDRSGVMNSLVKLADTAFWTLRS